MLINSDSFIRAARGDRQLEKVLCHLYVHFTYENKPTGIAEKANLAFEKYINSLGVELGKYDMRVLKNALHKVSRGLRFLLGRDANEEVNKMIFSLLEYHLFETNDSASTSHPEPVISK